MRQAWPLLLIPAVSGLATPAPRAFLTREQGQNGQLRQLLEARSITTTELPCIAFERLAGFDTLRNHTLREDPSNPLAEGVVGGLLSAEDELDRGIDEAARRMSRRKPKHTLCHCCATDGTHNSHSPTAPHMPHNSPTPP